MSQQNGLVYCGNNPFGGQTIWKRDGMGLHNPTKNLERLRGAKPFHNPIPEWH
jgi:hypothetical protein